MIYTIGKADAYDQYIRSDPTAAKGVTGSVWRKLEQAKAHAALGKGFKVYGVRARWGIDTRPDPSVPGCDWHEMIRPGKLVQLAR